MNDLTRSTSYTFECGRAFAQTPRVQWGNASYGEQLHFPAAAFTSSGLCLALGVPAAAPNTDKISRKPRYRGVIREILYCFTPLSPS